MSSDSVVEALDVFSDNGTGVFWRGEGSAMVDVEFVLQRPKEALHGCIIMALGGSTEASQCAHGGEVCREGIRCELAATVGVKEKPRLRSTQRHRSSECRSGQLGVQLTTHLPAHDTTTEEVEDGHEKRGAVFGAQMGRVSQPNAVGCLGREPSVEDVRSDDAEARPGCQQLPTTRRASLQSHFSH